MESIKKIIKAIYSVVNAYKYTVNGRNLQVGLSCCFLIYMFKSSIYNANVGNNKNNPNQRSIT